jgi:hypothetical protein
LTEEKLSIKRTVAIQKKAATEMLKKLNRSAAYEAMFETL